MSIREVIQLLTELFNLFMEYFGDIFAGLKGEDEEAAPEA